MRADPILPIRSSGATTASAKMREISDAKAIADQGPISNRQLNTYTSTRNTNKIARIEVQSSIVSLDVLVYYDRKD